MRYSEIFKGILSEFKEDIEIHRMQKTGEDAYGRPTYAEQEVVTVKGIFQEGTISYEHSELKIGEVKNPKVFLPLDTEIEREDKLYIRGKQYAIISINRTNLQIELEVVEVKP